MSEKAPLTYEDYRETSFFPALDGLRAIAVTLVLFIHFGGDIGLSITGRLGVEIFFVLSGFLITTLLLREKDETGSVNLRKFYISRAFRIMPIYYTVLIFVIWQTFNLADDRWTSLKDALPYYFLFCNEFFTGNALWKVTWSLGIEWKYYLCWPLAAFFIARSTRSRLIAAAFLILLSFAAWGSPVPIREYSVLVYGSLLAIIMHDRTGFKIISFLMRPRVSIAVFVFFAVFQTQTGRIWGYAYNARLDNMYSIVVILLIPAILGPGLPGRILSSAPFVFVGRRSYSLYLIQPLAQHAVSGFAPWQKEGFWNVFLILVTGLFISDVLLRYVEKPCIEFGRQINRKRDNVRQLATQNSI
ncbi:acyltransferase family protein [Nitrospirillum iridis]|uniref:Peptidoglycan/LPS O-acetylase OafA/YrhL n=1 Tax=Nitrospirillum iridis TaxID=765888 RepID=A0A7X0AUW5_9PROT|nr:acyltransferase [Nitrospirillum iridis]MBB6250567.1 peptidoglycan/LPS O-acetylase OafA/YrhL [Nitrospirillum iridis]